MTDFEEPRAEEVDLDFPREWIEFIDPADPDTMVRADLTWLLSSWTCIFGAGCAGIMAEQSEDGCCVHGAFYTDADDEHRVAKAAKRLTPDTWQHYRERFSDTVADDTLENEKGEQEPARRTATVDDACVFLNRPGFAAGAGCALHAQALRDGVHPMEYKPDVCWQLPIKRDYTTIKRQDGSTVEVTWIGEFDRRAWGEGGHDLHWWCTSAPSAHTGGRPLYQSYEPELTAMLGKRAYARLAEFCAARSRRGLIAVHPATAKHTDADG